MTGPILRCAVRALIACGVVAMGTGISRAALVYSTFDNPPGTAFTFSASRGVTGSSTVIGTLGWAQPFTSSGDFTVTQIDFAIFGDRNVTGSDSVNIEILADSSGLPGTQIGSTYLVNFTESSPGVVTLTGINDIALQAGATYWLAMLPGAPDTRSHWIVNLNLPPVSLARNQGSGWSSAGQAGPAYADIIGTQAPEPGTTASLCVGLSIVATLRRRLRQSR